MSFRAYDPKTIAKFASDESTRAITVTAADSCASLGLSTEDVWEVLRRLEDPQNRFVKPIKSTTNPKEFLDVYDVVCRSIPVYLKLKLSKDANGEFVSVAVLSFK